jgi:hypothetical protein
MTFFGRYGFSWIWFEPPKLFCIWISLKTVSEYWFNVNSVYVWKYLPNLMSNLKCLLLSEVKTKSNQLIKRIKSPHEIMSMYNCINSVQLFSSWGHTNLGLRSKHVQWSETLCLKSIEVGTDLELSELLQYCYLQNQISIMESKIQIRNQKSIWLKKTPTMTCLISN